MEKQALIFGHKNPDTDSICSSLVHETLNKKVGWEAKAVRLGNINKETRVCAKLFRNRSTRTNRKSRRRARSNTSRPL